jgi:hypothetical protein
MTTASNNDMMKKGLFDVQQQQQQQQQQTIYKTHAAVITPTCIRSLLSPQIKANRNHINNECNS